MSLPKPPDEWLKENGYPRGWFTLTDAQRAKASAVYEYEQRMGRKPPDPFPEGTLAHRQFEYRSTDPDPLELAQTREVA